MKKIIAFLMLVICSLGVLMSQSNLDTLSTTGSYWDNYDDPCNGCYPYDDYIYDYLTNNLDSLPPFIEEMFSNVVNFQYYAPDDFGIVVIQENIFDTVNVSMLITDTLEWSPLELVDMEVNRSNTYGTEYYVTQSLDGYYTKNITINKRWDEIFGKIRTIKIELIPNSTSDDYMQY